MKEVNLPDIPVMYITAESMDKIKDAFSKLESYFPSLKGRKFYGTFHNGIYRACVAVNEGDNPKALGLETEIIPGGKYAVDKMDDWPKHIGHIKQRFMEMMEKAPFDESRPSIEFYKSFNDLILYLPIK